METVLGAAAGVLAAWLILIVMIVARRPSRSGAREALRVLPDTVRLLKRLAADRSLPTTVRLCIYAGVAYLVSPIDLIPDFLPVLGYADDVVIVAILVRSVLRRAGPDAIGDSWPGTEEGLEILFRLIGTTPPPAQR